VTTPRLVGTDFGGPGGAGVLLLGPSLGTSAATLWGAAAQRLAEHVRVVVWDLPGHGRSPASAPFRVPELAAGVVALSDEISPGRAFSYSGDSIDGAVGLQLLLNAPDRVMVATLVCTGAAFGDPEQWRIRAATERASGLDAVADRVAELIAAHLRPEADDDAAGDDQ
jgi:3-oxoadipate enol-lactonase/4-carboxymuconolactone decarboxylase